MKLAKKLIQLIISQTLNRKKATYFRFSTLSHQFLLQKPLLILNIFPRIIPSLNALARQTTNHLSGCISEIWITCWCCFVLIFHHCPKVINSWSMHENIKIKKYLLRNLCYKLLTLQNYFNFILKNTPKKGDLKYFCKNWKQKLSLSSSLFTSTGIGFFLLPEVGVAFLFIISRSKT